MPRTRVAVIGAGLAGTFATLALAERGVAVTLFEALEPGHDRGSSHGGSRIFRHAYPDEDHVRLAVRADEGWRALERNTGERLLWRAGGLDFVADAGEELSRIESALDSQGSRWQRLTAAEVRARFPAFDPPDETEALYQPDAGVLAADRALTAALRRAAELGAELRFDTPVDGWHARGGHVEVVTGSGQVAYADRLVLSAGPWLAQGPLAISAPLDVEQQQVVYLAAPPGPVHSAGIMPVFIDRDSGTYGMGRLEHPAAIKVADHRGGTSTVLNDRSVTVDDEWARRTAERVARLLPNLGPRLSASLCLYTKTPDEAFLIGALPGVPEVVVAAGLSGHGFKFGPALGELLADLAVDGVSRWWSHRFAPERFDPDGSAARDA